MMTRKPPVLILLACLFTTPAHSQRVELILDGSGSMWGEVGGEAKIVAAKRTMASLVGGIELPPGSTLGLTVYGHRAKGDCADIEHFPAGGLRPALGARAADRGHPAQGHDAEFTADSQTLRPQHRTLFCISAQH